MPGPKLNSTKKPSFKAGFAAKAKGKSHAEANVAGYEKRQARKAKSGPALTDIYEHIQQNKGRRAKVGMDLDRDEAKEFGVGLDGEGDEERDELRARLIGELEDDEEVASEDDEEVDSDAAFEESDEERFAGFFSSKKSKGKSANKKTSKPSVRFAAVNLDEDEDMESNNDKSEGDDTSEEEEEEEGEDDEFIDLLDVLDGKGDIDMGSDDEITSKPASGSSSRDAETEKYKELEHSDEDSEDNEDSEEEEDDDDDESEDDQMSVEPSDDEEAPEALDQLNDFVSKLDATVKKRKAPEDDSNTFDIAEARSRKRRFTKERTEAGDENEFRAHSSSSKLNLGDLLAPLSTQSSALQSLKKSTKVLEPSGSAKAKTLSAPLPQRTQERLDRQAAYEQTKEEVDKWTDTMKRIREAEHLSFPLQAQPSGRASNLELNAKFKPTTELESAVDALLKSAKMREEDIHQTEDRMLEMNKLSVDEVAQRRSELRKMRELMFRAEIKARRVGKIKSKTYRRLRRKEKERLGEQIDEGDSDPEAGQLKQELDRARERATLRHKHTGKWARQMRNKEGMDGDSRRDIEEMLARGEKLRRRIKGVGSDESEDEEDEDEDEDKDLNQEANIEKIKRTAFDELRQLDAEDNSEQGEGEKKNSKSVFEMKFMKDAMARREFEVGQEKDDFIREMGGHVSGGEDSDVEQDDKVVDPSHGVVARKAGGRIVYRPGAPSGSNLRPINSLASDTSSVTLRSTDLLSPPLSPPQNRHSGLSSTNAPVQDSNPWLTQDSKGKNKAAKKVNQVVVGKESKPADKSKNRLKKATEKQEELREQVKDDATVEISLDTVLAPAPASTTAQPSNSKASQKSKSKAKDTGASLTPAADADSDDSDDDNIELEAQEQELHLKGKGKGNGLKAFEQRDLVALAFAGDNVVQSFEDAKRREIVSDAPREVDTTIPGWGSWGGTGVQKAPPKPSRIKKIAGIDPTTRADYNKKNIIISEKRDKKAAKYLVKDLPYPYTSKAQFERAMDRPLGVEWNTRVAFQRGTLPKVVKKPGVIIDPLEKHTL